MIKKILLITLIFFSFFSYSFWAAWTPLPSPGNTPWAKWTNYNNWNYSTKQIKTIQKQINTTNSGVTGWTPLKVDGMKWPLTTAAMNNYNKNNPNNISSPNFQIDVWSISPGNNKTKWDTAKESATLTLQAIIDNLIVAFWVLALLVMTVGWGYMIMYHGQDELLSKWKSIFTSGLIAVAVALSAWILVKLVAYLLY